MLLFGEKAKQSKVINRDFRKLRERSPANCVGALFSVILRHTLPNESLRVGRTS